VKFLRALTRRWVHRFYGAVPRKPTLGSSAISGQRGQSHKIHGSWTKLVRKKRHGPEVGNGQQSRPFPTFNDAQDISGHAQGRVRYPVLAQNCPDGSWMGASRNIRPSSSGSTLIAMVQTANLREGNDVT